MDFFNATADDLKNLGWTSWPEVAGLWLCPLAQFGDLPDGIALHSISGEIAVKGRDYTDLDTRGGFIAWGIVPGETTTDASAEFVAERAAVKAGAFRALIADVCAENGLYDLASGRTLRGAEAAEAIFAMGAKGDA